MFIFNSESELKGGSSTEAACDSAHGERQIGALFARTFAPVHFHGAVWGLFFGRPRRE